MRERLASILTICAVSLASPSPAIAAPLVPLHPWILDYADTQCVASRDYGTESSPLTLAIRSSPNGDTYELFVLRKSAGPQFAEELKGTVDFGQGPISTWVLHYSVPMRKSDLYQFRISAAEMDQARGAARVSLNIRGGLEFAFTLEAMPNLLKGLAACTVDLKQYWNFDGEKNGRIAVPSKGDVRGVFTSEDYPNEALSRNQQGSSQFLLLIDEHGKVAGCHVLSPSGVPVLDAMGCSVIRERAKFTSARGSDGKPVRSMVVTPQISWRLEN